METIDRIENEGGKLLLTGPVYQQDHVESEQNDEIRQDEEEEKRTVSDEKIRDEKIIEEQETSKTQRRTERDAPAQEVEMLKGKQKPKILSVENCNIGFDEFSTGNQFIF